MSARKNTCIVGLTWGDEAKGKIVDILSAEHDVVVRYNGGNNAGHTVAFGGETYKLHLVPSGLFHPHATCIIGGGLVVDPKVLLEEITAHEGVATGLRQRLLVSSRAHTIWPWHKKIEALSEKHLGKGKIGTTLRGIGPAYGDKANRVTAIRMGEFLRPAHLRPKVERIVASKNKVFTKVFDDEPLDAAAVWDEYAAYGEQLAPMIADTTAWLHRALDNGQRLLFEGAQGTLLDIDHGTYPYVTSSSASVAGVWPGTGVPARAIDEVLGVVKAYTTRVGEGPFPTELTDAIGDQIREQGHEYGTTTGRARRCGWLDTFAIRYAARLNQVDGIVITLLDVLGGLPELKICTGYLVDGQTLDEFPDDPPVLERAEPMLENLEPWPDDITGARAFDDLPGPAKAYVNRVEELVGAPVRIISIGPDREQTILRE
ncbi:MAG: adenylosuccinate synthetase [Planctomycetes bacterium DG_20]|nr:MAG: adenylosuccinate synthetase [Planctomycetes bacterium DG_20]